MPTGAVKEFDEERGFGFIECDVSGKEAFFHESEVEFGNSESLEIGREVEFVVTKSPLTRFDIAVDVETVENEEEIESGDVVEIVSLDSTQTYFAASSKLRLPGEKFEVHRSGTTGMREVPYVVEKREDATCSYHLDDVELVEKSDDEFPKFSVGDRVKVTDSGYINGQVSVELEEGEEYTIKDLSLDQYEEGGIVLEEKGPQGFYRVQRFEKVEDREDEFPKFSVGDDVVVKRTGEKGMIEETCECDFDHVYYLEGSDEPFKAEALELASESNPEDAIAVRVDDEDLFGALVEKLEKSEFSKDFAIRGPARERGLYIGLSEGGSPIASTYFYRQTSLKENCEVGDLSDNFQRGLNFIDDFEENKKSLEPPSLDGYEVEFYEATSLEGEPQIGIKVGCWHGALEELLAFKEYAKKICVDSGKLDVKTPDGLYPVYVEELFEFIEELEDYVEEKDDLV